MGRKIAKRIRGMNWMAKVSLILIFTMVLSAFMYQGWYKPKFTEATGTTNGRAVFSNNTTTPQNSAYTASTNTFAVGAATIVGAIPSFMVNGSAPTRNENIAGYVTTGGVLYIIRWNGAAWTNEFNVTVAGNGVNGRRFDIAYEKTSGNAMVVYSTNNLGNAGTAEMAYRVWNGTSWTAAANVVANSAGFNQAAAVTWIKLKARPTSGSNEIALTAADTGTTTANTSILTSFIWDGAAWTEAATTHTGSAVATLPNIITTQLMQNDCFDLAYESLSGDLLVVFTTASTVQQWYRTKTAAGVWGTATSFATARAAPLQMIAESNPYTDQILVMWNRSASTAAYGRIWDGTAMSAVTTISANAVTTAVNKKHITGKWLRVGGTDYAVAIWQTSTIGTIGYNYFTGAAWGTAATLAGVGATSALSWLDSDVDPFVPDTLMLTGSYLNATNIVLARRLVLTAVPVFTWTTPAGSPMGSALTNVTTQNFGFAYDRKDNTPPTAGTVTVSPDTGTYTSGSPTITTVFTDAESAVTTCEYTTNGSTWNPGTVSGSSPNYTCTGSPIGLSGALTINMRANSAGGTTTATAINRTVDITGPTDGILTVALADPTSLFLSWTAATDGGSGPRTTNTYDVRFLTGATPPTCLTGVSIYTGVGLSYTHTGLTTGQQYSYRVCAYDNVNNPSAGATGSGAPKWPATTTSCAGCHGYSSLFPDGTTRNTPVGQFVGSHNKHVITAGKACNVCHVTPATETSVNYAHRNSNIQMKIGATVIDGGYYDRNNNSAYNAGTDDTFLQTNSPTLGPCRTVYCHSQGTSATSNITETRLTVSTPLTIINWGVAGSCSTTCHGYPPSYANGAITWGAAKANSHSKHQTQCSTCHNTTTTNSTSITGPANHANKLYTVFNGNGATFTSYTYAATGGSCTVISCHSVGGVSDTTRQWGTTLPATFKCITCHAVTQAITVGPLAGGGNMRSAVVSEFGLTWGHKKTGRAAVADADCIVCHLEGNYTTQLRSTYHGDGYIDLRDPDVAGETRITNIAGVSYRFEKFSTSYAAVSRTSTGQLAENVDNILTQKFCLKCHDSLGAANTTARTVGGTAFMPFGGINLGVDYTIANGAAAAGGLINVMDQTLTTNSSRHPIQGPNNRDFPWSSRLAVPYNNGVSARDSNNATTHVMANSVVINCFDCHNTPTTALTARTVVAHGNAVTLRGVIYGTSPTLCSACHIGGTYSGAVQHGAGSGNQATGNKISIANNDICSNCHASATAAPVRPIRAQDYHGHNRLAGSSADALWPVGATETSRPYAFIRNTVNYGNHRPYRSSEFTTGTATCTVGTGTCSTMGTYTPGGTF